MILNVMLSAEQKLLLLKEILSRNNILFGSYNDFAEGKRKKKLAWEEIKSVMESNGIKKESEVWRDVVWRNIRGSTMKKVDNRRQTGSDGGVDKKLSEADEMVLAIIGRESPIMQGLRVTETEVVQLQATTSDNVVSAGQITKCVAKRKTGKRAVEVEKDELLLEHLRLKNKKLRLEIKILKRQVSDSDSD